MMTVEDALRLEALRSSVVRAVSAADAGDVGAVRDVPRQRRWLSGFGRRESLDNDREEEWLTVIGKSLAILAMHRAELGSPRT